MRIASRRTAPTLVGSLATAIAALLGVRFLTSVTLVAVAPPPETLALVGAYSEAFEVALPLAILPVLFVLTWGWVRGALPRAAWVAILGVHVAALVVWLGFLVGFLPAAIALAFPYLAVVATACASLLCLLGPGRPRGWFAEPRWQAHLVLLALIPLATALRIGAGLGLGAWESGGVLHGNWFVVNLPTLLIEFFVIGIWLFVVLDAGPARVRQRWYALLPFAALLLPVVFEARPLAGYVFSALITWGSNLELFVPTVVSLSLAAAAVAFYLSTFLLLPRSRDKRPWDLLWLGTLTIILSGFFASMASVEGLAWGSVLVTLALRSWGRPP